jgi:iron complex outermembrane receptor protein
MSKISIAMVLLYLGLGSSIGAQADDTADEAEPGLTGLEIDIPAQPVGDALNAFAEQSGLQVVIYADIGDDVQTEPVVGRFNNEEEALIVLLASTGLDHEYINERTVSVKERGEIGDHKRGKSRPASGQTLLTQNQVPAQQTQTTAPLRGTDQVQEDAPVIDEIMVTARRKAEPIQNVPISITALSGADLDNLSIRDLSGTADFAPNVSFQQGGPGSGGSSLIYIRGVGSIGVDSPRNDTGVGVYVDGVFLPRMQGGIRDLLDLERVEILRGPQGTLFGKNTIGGAIHLITKKPSEEFYGSGRVELGNHNMLNTRFKVNVPISDNFFVSLASMSNNHDGFSVSLENGERYDDKNRQSTRLAARWIPNDRATVDFTADYVRIREVGVGRRLTYADPTSFLIGIPSMARELNGLQPIDETWMPGPHQNFMDSPNQNHGDDWGVALSFDYDIGDTATLSSITSYRELEMRGHGDGDGFPMVFFEGTVRELDQNQISQEIRVAGTGFDSKFDWLVGAYYFLDENFNGDATRLFSGVFDLLEALPGPVIPPVPGVLDPALCFIAYPCWGGPGNPLNAVPWPPQEQQFKTQRSHDSTSWATFLHGTYQFTDRFSLTAGVRYSWEEKQEQAFVNRHIETGEAGACPPATDCYVVKESWTSWTPKFSLEFQATPKHLIYASVSNGFKSGGFNAAPSLPPFEPEELTAYEIGAKTDWFDDRLRMNVAAFYNDYTDLQLAGLFLDVNTGEAFVFTANAGVAEIKGIELEATWRANDYLTFVGTLGRMTNEFSELREGVTDIVTGTTIPFQPERVGSASIILDFPMGKNGAIKLRTDVISRSFTYLTLANEDITSQPGFEQYNARITYAPVDGNWELAFFGTNLTDEDFITYAFGGINSGNVISSDGAPRVWGVSARFDF